MISSSYPHRKSSKYTTRGYQLDCIFRYLFLLHTSSVQMRFVAHFTIFNYFLKISTFLFQKKKLITIKLIAPWVWGSDYQTNEGSALRDHTGVLSAADVTVPPFSVRFGPFPVRPMRIECPEGWSEPELAQLKLKRRCLLWRTNTSWTLCCFLSSWNKKKMFSERWGYIWGTLFVQIVFFFPSHWDNQRKNGIKTNVALETENPIFLVCLSITEKRDYDEYSILCKMKW